MWKIEDNSSISYTFNFKEFIHYKQGIETNTISTIIKFQISMRYSTKHITLF